MRYVIIVIMFIFLGAAAAAGISAVSPDVAEAAGGRVAKCGGGKILLNAKEKRSFVLHNNVRRKTISGLSACTPSSRRPPAPTRRT